ncbi:VTT domain-containing protein [Rhodopirellula baltica]|uniref:Membrane protein containing SNARE domain protein n=1 Tax=Rhodopirellula baltica SWK14 TaxID=993516 RepID=L7CD78_RHOBT|nr:VTT domain-containing protein [Rhodopirellula baltica]ELP31041.1 membrane protein containing SNARE domain protein [Rhodopirellula baltica SWK14]
MPAETTAAKINQYVRWGSIAVVVASLLVIIRTLPFDVVTSAMNEWIGSLGWWGPVVLVLLYIIATVLFVPGTILTLAAGAIFGLLVGTIVVSIGSTIGAALAFLISRYVARERVAELAKDNRRFAAIDRAIEEGGWKIVGLLRLSPALPFNLQNYLYGLTPIRFWPYVLTSWIAMLPATFLYVYLGHVTGAAVGADRERTTAEWAMLAVGLLATIAVTVYVTRLASRKLDEQVDQDQRENADTSKQSGSVAASNARRTVLLATIAVSMVLLAVYVSMNSGDIESTVTRWLGPPAVDATETHSPNPSGPNIDHSLLDEVLATHVQEGGWVNYEALRDNTDKLDRYLDVVASAPWDALSRDEKLALLLNGYNASTLKLILDHYPVDSIKDIPATDRWDAVRWNIGGNIWSLNQIEHEQIRPNFKEPRIHFALVCAAVGCPPLRSEAYHPDRLNEQLEDQTRIVHDHATWFEHLAGSNELRLTKLYDWYAGDFLQSAESLPHFAATYSQSLRQANDSEQDPTVEWLPYDWSLNSHPNCRPR